MIKLNKCILRGGNMSKHIIRILVTLIILSTIGYGAWVFFLKPNDNEYVYTQMLNVLETVNDGEINTKLTQLSEKDYMGSVAPSETNGVTRFASGTTLYNVREFMFQITNQTAYEKYYGVAQNGFNVYVNEDDTTNFSYIDYDQILDAAMSYYAPYTQFATGVGSEEIKNYNAAQKTYEKTYNEAINKINIIINYQNNNQVLDSTKTIVLTDYYKQLLVLVNDYYAAYTNFVIVVQNFVSEFASDSQFIYDLEPIYLNSAVYTISKFTKIANFASVDFSGVSLNAAAIANNQYLAESAMYYYNYQNQEKELNVIFELVNNYNTLASNYSEILFGNNNVFARTHVTKVNIVNGESAAVADIREEFIPLVQNLLIQLGFEAPVEPEESEEPEIPGRGSNPDGPFNPGNPDGPTFVEFK